MSDVDTQLGNKYTCFKCSCRFYDLGRPQPLCPRCGADQREDPNPDPRTAFLSRYRKSNRPSRKRSRKRTRTETTTAEMPAQPEVSPQSKGDDDDLLD